MAKSGNVRNLVFLLSVSLYVIRYICFTFHRRAHTYLYDSLGLNVRTFHSCYQAFMDVAWGVIRFLQGASPPTGMVCPAHCGFRCLVPFWQPFSVDFWWALGLWPVLLPPFLDSDSPPFILLTPAELLWGVALGGYGRSRDLGCLIWQVAIIGNDFGPPAE